MRKPATKAQSPVDVSRLHEDHPKVCAQDWRSPLVRRLLGSSKYADSAASLDDSYRAQDLQKAVSQLPLQWRGLKDDFERRINSYQDHILAEHATLGLACILLTRHTKFRISEVCRRGESVDYWIGDGKLAKRFLLEVGGQQSGSLEALSTEKSAQLRKNPWGRSGLICVAVYEKAAARLWYCTHGSTS